MIRVDARAGRALDWRYHCPRPAELDNPPGCGSGVNNQCGWSASRPGANRSTPTTRQLCWPCCVCRREWTAGDWCRFAPADATRWPRHSTGVWGNDIRYAPAASGAVVHRQPGCQLFLAILRGCMAVSDVEMANRLLATPGCPRELRILLASQAFTLIWPSPSSAPILPLGAQATSAAAGGAYAPLHQHPCRDDRRRIPYRTELEASPARCFMSSETAPTALPMSQSRPGETEPGRLRHAGTS